LLATYDDFWHVYNKKTNKHCYEVIRENVSCKLYFDLEYIRACNSHIQEDVLIESLFQLVKQGLKQILKRKEVSENNIVLCIEEISPVILTSLLKNACYGLVFLGEIFKAHYFSQGK
jgi:hypothetical protein